MLDSYARQIKRERNHESRVRYYSDKILRMKEEQQRELAKEEAGKQKAEMKNKAASDRHSMVPSGSRKNEISADASAKKNQNGSESMSLPKLRKALIEKAKERGEDSEIMQIIGDPPEKLHDRWQRYRQENARQKNNIQNILIKKKRKKRK